MTAGVPEPSLFWTCKLILSGPSGNKPEQHVISVSPVLGFCFQGFFLGFLSFCFLVSLAKSCQHYASAPERLICSLFKILIIWSGSSRCWVMKQQQADLSVEGYFSWIIIIGIHVQNEFLSTFFVIWTHGCQEWGLPKVQKLTSENKISGIFSLTEICTSRFSPKLQCESGVNLEYNLNKLAELLLINRLFIWSAFVPPLTPSLVALWREKVICGRLSLLL